MFAVYSAYWQLGQGMQLVEPGMNHCQPGKTRHGVSAAEMGAKLCKSFGHHQICEIRQEGEVDNVAECVMSLENTPQERTLHNMRAL